jgi:isoleucyl-tRNA synthetase
MPQSNNNQLKSQFSIDEEDLLKTWKREKTFEKSLQNRKGKKRFSFYDGPPFASGEPHYGHVEQTTVKDAVVRYKTMRGFYVPRRTGWDTHGLPIEFQIEKELQLKTKQDILKYGVDKFNEACRAAVFRYQEHFDQMYERLGRWGDPKETYATLNDEYIESVWWVFARIYEKGLIYRGYKSVPYCPRCATPLSNFEVNDGYKDDVADPSLYVKFKLENEDLYLLAWTTTPWSLPGNATVAVQPDETYVTVETIDELGNKQNLIIAQKRQDVIDGKYKVISKYKGADLVGKTYEPLYMVDAKTRRTHPNLYKVIADKQVSVDDGTGLLHVAPAYGETDLRLGQEHGLPVIQDIDENGHVKENVALKEARGKFFKAVDKIIIADLAKRNLVYAVDSSFTHTYPFCWRCETPLLYYAINTWFLAVTQIKNQLITNAEATSWVPTHVKKGRFIKWLEGARDWAISRNRFWGAPIPIWVCGNGHLTVIVSIEALRKKARSLPDNFDMHKPGIDEVKIACDDCQEEATRVPEVLDCWFESGSMPYAQDHYPFENKQKFEESFPADFVVEAIEQVHLWFYTLHVLSTALFDKPAYKNVVADGLILAADGKKLSKRLRNYPPIEDLLNKFGADTTRFFILSSPLMSGQDTRMSEGAFKDIYRNVFMTLNNVFNFYKTYTEIDNFKPKKGASGSSNVLDLWIMSRLNQTIEEVTKHADKYHLAKATRPLADFVDDLSNWYVRRSRRRFWKSENDADKLDAYQTLHHVLITTSQLFAPWAPFLSDKIYHAIKAERMPESVHLTDWPKAETIDRQLIIEMAKTRDYITEGLQKRAVAGIKVRQPLQKATVPMVNGSLRQIIQEELNVKEIIVSQKADGIVMLETKITHILKLEGLAREIIRHVQQFRKESGLNVEDRINLRLASENGNIKDSINNFTEMIKTETLAVELTVLERDERSQKVSIEGAELFISLNKNKG